MTQTYYSNGKLLITGEYVVLNGATALALPTKFGQSLLIEPSEVNGIKWSSFDADGSCWFETTISFDEVKNKLKTTDDAIKNTLIEILHEAFLLNPSYLLDADGYTISTHLTFPKKWGLGTSSTLINNIANWLAVDAYTLLKNSFGGSGYDLACAQNDSAILYQLINEKPNVQLIPFHPIFSNAIYFVYLNKKQNSKTAIANYFNRLDNMEAGVEKITKYTQQALLAKSLEEFSAVLLHHEIEMSTILEQQTIQEALFFDFDGVIKSLGAWGGDFVMVLSKTNPSSYFIEKGYHVILTYEEMIL